MSDRSKPKFGSRKSDLAVLAGGMIVFAGIFLVPQSDSTAGGIVLIVVGVLIALPGLVAVGIRLARDETTESQT